MSANRELHRRPALSAAVFGLMLAACAAWYLAGVQSPEQIGRTAAAAKYSQTALKASLNPARVAARQAEIAALGRRLLGDPGHAATARYLAGQFRELGLEVIERRDRVVAPVIESAAITTAAGSALPGVTLHPFQPNLFQPMVTPEGGLRGRLVLLDEATIQTTTDFSDIIGVVDMASVPVSFGYDWVRYAQLGIRGIILANREGNADWSSIWQKNTMVSSLPANFVRVYAEGPIFQHLGEDVAMDVRQVYREVENTSLVAILKAKSPSEEALVLTAGYGTYGLLPTLVNDAQQAWFPATLLALAEGMAPYRDSLTRDVIFVSDGAEMMAGIGDAAVVAALGPQGREADTSLWLGEEITTHERMLALVASCQGLLSDSGFLRDGAVSLEKLHQLGREQREFFDEQLRIVLQTAVFDAGEEVLISKLPIDRSPEPLTSGPEFEVFQTRVAAFNKFQALSSAGVERIFERKLKPEILEKVRERLRERFEALDAHHQFRLARAKADVRIHEVTAKYEALFVLAPRLLPKESAEGSAADLAVFTGEPVGQFSINRQAPLLNALVGSLAQGADFRDRLRVSPVRPADYPQVEPTLGRIPFPTRFWTRFAHPAFAVVNTDRLEAYRALTEPADSQRNEGALPTGLDASLDFLGSLVLSIGHGELSIRPADHPVVRSFSGAVLASNVGQSVVPNYPLESAVVGLELPDPLLQIAPGFYVLPLLMSDVYGRYELLNTPADFLSPTVPSYSPQAFWYGSDGIIAWAKDRTGSQIFKSEELPTVRLNLTDINLVVFRAGPTSFFDLGDPQSMQSFAAVSLLRREGLSPFSSSNQFDTTETATAFLPPDRHFYAAMRAGAPDNPLVQTIRGFLLGPASGENVPQTGDVRGEGYLVADTPAFSTIAMPMAESMLRLNTARAELQARRNMLDEGISGLLERSAELLDQAQQAGQPHRDSVLLARESAAYSFLVHPILRSNISGAVLSILWYLGLLVPFVFFAEKLAFGFADIRKQLSAQAVIFLIVFGLLRVMHPAFEMIRSSFMILLGFVILLIAGGVSVLFAGKFRENLQALESLRGKAAGASVNTMGIVATAFMLGLNNMHRRKVRTGLTCATLVLITFAMIAFTSVRSDLVENVVPLGPAPYQGLLIKKEEGKYVSDSEVFALQTRYGNRYPVSARSFLVGNQNSWTKVVLNPALEIQTSGSATSSRSTQFQSILQLDPNEPLRDRITLLTRPFWFENQEANAAESSPIIISSRIARDLGVTPEQVDAAGFVPVLINGGNFRIAGIFDDQALNDLRDLDGQSLLPPDILGMANPKLDIEQAPLAQAGDPRMAAENVILMATGPLGVSVPNALPRNGSVVVGLPGLGYREAREMIFQYLEQTGATAFFGLDGVASRGMRTRASSFQGLLDMLMPLVIAALTVLNTMKGSVYERRDEIAVYNAVGIAPRYIFFMFFAEAFVYSVMGAVLGYLLSQGTGFVLTALNLTGGLNMTFAGPETILASLAVIAAVFISTIFPARTAMQIAAPSDDAGWSMPDPEGDEFSFALPFTFNPYDRLAVLAFFHRFLVDHGEGGSGRFHAAPPVMDCNGTDEDPVPRVTSTIWLKPYDLGVSEVMSIALPHDAETNEYIARITIERLTGTRESWMRLNRQLMVQVREQFLHWRAVTPAQKKEFYTSAGQLLEQEALRSSESGELTAGKETHV